MTGQGDVTLKIFGR